MMETMQTTMGAVIHAALSNILFALALTTPLAAQMFALEVAETRSLVEAKLVTMELL